MLLPFLKTQLLELARSKLLKLADRFRLVGEQVQVALVIAADLDHAIVDAVVDPVQRHAKDAGQLRYRQTVGDATRMRLTALVQQPMA